MQTASQLELSQVNDITSDNLFVDENTMEQQLDRSERDFSKRSALDNPSKRSEAALNIKDENETDDEENMVLEKQPDLDEVFDSKKEDEE